MKTIKISPLIINIVIFLYVFSDMLQNRYNWSEFRAFANFLVMTLLLINMYNILLVQIKDLLNKRKKDKDLPL